MFSRLPAHATFVVDTNFASETQKMFLNSFRNILRPQQMFPRLLAEETMLTRFQGLFCIGAHNIACSQHLFPVKYFFVCAARKQNNVLLPTRANGETFVSATMIPQQCFLVCVRNKCCVRGQTGETFPSATMFPQQCFLVCHGLLCTHTCTVAPAS